MNKFSIEDQYKVYLRLVKLTEEGMHPEQRKQIKQTFYAACGQMLMLMREDLSQLEEDDGVKMLEKMWAEVMLFMTEITKN